ncbi:MAG: macrolide ABC transporter ATP-binding protein [Candidatus Harrisonbacteria bacterium CG10_big_fil_rev_8_21_14_0_10_44_23]|uniref:Macrolide ABC transporter ATP-binding protein n=1 Tax=Candidatus Harrisonbacteria bacterium CG10_big_fil_rev_8_21_14_0_10_44_23 TaxID=1974585 RepID=A0A2H0UQ88_9BACT|nr:MAG: macrolide ABC transporter ATP-binding protein [Candidatus Harrisonbacteria bacterium CG10_big_fil_rev_8_21_14_0_10_44_23]
MLIKLEKVSKTYQSGEVKTEALKGVDLEIEEGEFVAIMGPSGSGKSTLMHILGFLDRPTGGVYEFQEKEIKYKDDDFLADLRNKSAGFVFQAFNLLPRTTVLENVELPLVYAQMDREKAQKKAKEVLEKVGMSHRIHHFSNQLSGGEKQRVAIARALINDPKVIFADEPTGNLDSKTGSQIMEILQDLNDDENRTIVLVTHETFAAEAAKRIIALKDGDIVEDRKVSKRRIARKGEFIK